MNSIKEQVGDYLHVVQITPPKFFKSGFDSACINMAVVRHSRAIEFILATGIAPKGVQAKTSCFGMCVKYHCPGPIRAGSMAHIDCEYTGGDCYCDVWCHFGAVLGEIFLEGGMDAVWPHLEQRWIETFREEE